MNTWDWLTYHAWEWRAMIATVLLVLLMGTCIGLVGETP